MKYFYLVVVLLIIIYFMKFYNNSEKFADIEFDTYVINLVKNTNRLKNFMNQYNNSDLSFKKIKVFPAIVGKDLDLIKYTSPEAYKQIIFSEISNTRKYHYNLTRGAVGCFLSHIAIYKKIIESNKSYGLIFEDDVLIATDVYKRLLYGLNKIPSNWDIFLLGVMCLKCTESNQYINVDRFWGLHGYLIKKDTAIKLVEHLDKEINKQIDAEISLMIKYKLLNVYAITPQIVIQDGNFGSDIQTPVENTIDSFNEEFDQRYLIKDT